MSEAVKNVDPSKAMEKAIGTLEDRVKGFADQMTGAFNQMYSHAESMAAHIIALEAIVAQLSAKVGVSQEEIESWIKVRVQAGTDGKGASDEALGVALDVTGVKPLYKK